MDVEEAWVTGRAETPECSGSRLPHGTDQTTVAERLFHGALVARARMKTCDDEQLQASSLRNSVKPLFRRTGGDSPPAVDPPQLTSRLLSTSNSSWSRISGCAGLVDVCVVSDEDSNQSLFWSTAPVVHQPRFRACADRRTGVRPRTVVGCWNLHPKPRTHPPAQRTPEIRLHEEFRRREKTRGKLRRIDGWRENRRLSCGIVVWTEFLRRTLGAVHRRTFSCAPWRRGRRGRDAPRRRWSVP